MLDISGDRLKPGPDGHIRHPQEKDLVWWEDSVSGERYWVRQNRWQKYEDIKTETNPREPMLMVEAERAKKMKRQLREEGVRYKVRRRPHTDWNADEGPWEYQP